MVGEEADAAAVLALPGTHLHVYGKEPRPARKIGHVTVTAANAEELQHRIHATAPLVPFVV
jgi:5-(carboxyamino)imidazole ribonucleotide synthase